MTVKHISGYSYFELLCNIKAVANEAHINLDKEEEINRLTEKENKCKFGNTPDLSVDKTAKKVSQFTVHSLVLYEAAKRCNLKKLSSHFLNRWNNEVVAKLDAIEQTECDISTIFNRLVQESVFPNFKEPESAEKEIMEKANNLLIKEIVHFKFHSDETAIPEFVEPLITSLQSWKSSFWYMGSQSDLDYQRYLTDKYAPLKNKIKIPEENRFIVIDDDIKTYLKRFPNLEILDLTGCMQITGEALSHGHKKLKQIFITNTQINGVLIDRVKFPELERIVNDSEGQVLDLDARLQFPVDWNSVLKEVCEAEKILILGSTQYKYDSLPVPNPHDRIYINLVLLQNRGKFAGPYSNDFLAKIAARIYDSVSYFKESEWDQNKQLAAMVGTSILALAASDHSCHEKFHLRLTYDLALTKVDFEKKKQTDELINFNGNIRGFLRFILRHIKESGWMPNYNFITKLLAARACDVDEIRFKQGSRGRDDLVQVKELINEITVELSHLNKTPADPGCLNNFANPKTEVRKNEFIDNGSLMPLAMFLNPLFSENTYPKRGYDIPLKQTMACAFALKVTKNEIREKLLQHILNTFSSQIIDGSGYPLCKIILGVVEEEDIPEHDHNSLLKSRLLSYKGIMQEPIPQDLKNKFWDALLKGRLGGKTNRLVDALALYHQKTKDPAQRGKALNALKMLGGISESAPEGQMPAYFFLAAFKDYACAKYNELKDKPESSLALKDP